MTAGRGRLTVNEVARLSVGQTKLLQSSGREVGPVRNVEDIWPLFGLRVTSGSMELRVIRDADIPALVDLAERGIQDRDAMPFSFPWSTVPAAELGRNMAAFYRRKRAEFSASASREQRRDGELAISQRLVLRPEDLRRPRYDVHVKGVRRFADSSDSTPERPLMPRAALVRTCDGWQPNGSFHG